MDAKFLTIELDNINSVPRVFYKGEEVTNKVLIQFQWQTRKDEEVQILNPIINIETLQIDSFGKPFDKNIRHVGDK